MNTQAKDQTEKIRYRRLVVLVTAILVLFLAAVPAQAKETAAASQNRLVNQLNTALNSAKFRIQAQTKKIKGTANKLIAGTGITRALRSAGIVKTTVPGYYQALNTQNPAYDYNNDGVVTGEDYPVLLADIARDSRKKIVQKQPEILVSEQMASAQPAINPSIRAFGTDDFNGAATVSYPINLPAYKAGLSPALVLAYSSASVDDLQVGVETKWRNDPQHSYQRQAGLVGLGWNLGGMQSISRDPAGTLDQDGDDTYVISFSGGAATLTKESGDDDWSVWRTAPNLKIKVERFGRCKTFEYNDDHDTINLCRFNWLATDGGGNKYYFGYPTTVNDWHRPEDPDSEDLPEGENNDWYPLYDDIDPYGSVGYSSWLLNGSSGKGYHALQTKWLLYQAESVYDQSGPPQPRDPGQEPACTNGCEAEVSYWYSFVFGSKYDHSYVQADYPLRINYGFGDHQVLFETEPRLDYQVHSGDDTSDDQVFQSKERLKKIIIQTRGKTVGVYKFNYHYGWDPTAHHDDGDGTAENLDEVVAGKAIHSLLDKITVYNDDPDVNPNSKRLPSYTFSYGDNCAPFTGGCPLTAFVQKTETTQVKTANDFFLITADNGYNGKVRLEYYSDGGGNNALDVVYCDPDKQADNGDICRSDHAFNTQRHRIKAKITEDGMGNFVRTENNYTGAGSLTGLAYVKQYGDIKEWYQGQNCCNVRNGQCQSGNPDEDCRCPGDSETCVSNHEWDCVGGTNCGWDEANGACCPFDLPDEYLAKCTNPRDNHRYTCPGTPSQPNTQCFSNCKYRSDIETFSDFEFLGYPEVETVVYEKNSTTEKAAKTKSFYRQAMETSSCFKPSPLKGAPYKTYVYDVDYIGRYQETKNYYAVRFGNMFGPYEEKRDDELSSYCESYDLESTVSLVMPTETVAKSVFPNPQLCTKTTTDYHKLEDGSNDDYALPHKLINWGKVSCDYPNPDYPADSATYSYTDYTQANLEKGINPLPKESWVSDVNGTDKYSHSRTYYDGEDLGVIGDYGDVTKSQALTDGSVYAESTISYQTDHPWLAWQTVDPLGRTTTVDFDNVFYLYPVQVTNALNQSAVTEYDFNTHDSSHPNYGDMLRVPVKATDPNGAVTTSVYDDFGRLTETYLPGKSPGPGVKASQIYGYFYFNQDDISPCSSANNCLVDLGKQISGQFGPKMLAAQGGRVTDDGTIGKMSATHKYYDGLGQEVQSRQMWYDGEWSSAGLPVEGEEPKDILSSTNFTALGQPANTSLAYTAPPYIPGSPPQNSYDTRDLVTDPGIKRTSYSYDGFGRLSTTLFADETREEVQYEVDGNPLKTKLLSKNCLDSDPNTPCLEKITTADAFGRTVRGEEAGEGISISASYEFHPITGQPTATKDTRENIVNKTEYDKLGRKIKMWDIDMSPSMSGDGDAWRYSYDELGNLVTQIDPKEITVNLTYDKLYRLSDKEVQSRGVVKNIYDDCSGGIGRLCKVISWLPSGEQVKELEYKYDQRGRTTENKVTLSNLPDTILNGQSFTTQYSYDEGGRLLSKKSLENSSLNIPEETITNLYDRPYLVSIQGDDAYVSAAGYNKNGQMMSFISGNGVINSYSYDSSNSRLTQLQVNGNNIPQPQKILVSYQYDPTGNIIKITDENPKLPGDPFYLTQEFTYDALSRLKTAANAYAAAYTYDDLNNIKDKTEGSETINLLYGNYTSGFYHRPQSVNGKNYQYDSVGNLTSDGLKNYSYDDSNQLVQVSDEANFIYDGGGQRLAKIVPSGSNTYYISPNLELTVNQSQANWLRNYYFGGRLAAVRSSHVNAPSPTPTPLPAPVCPAYACYVTCPPGSTQIEDSCAVGQVACCTPGLPTATPTLPPTPTPTPTPLYATYKVFVSSATYTGNLGGISGADNKCQSLALAAGLEGGYRAWVSTAAINAKDRVANVKYVLVDGTTMVADNKADLIDGTIDNKINKDEHGSSRTISVWTGTNGDGTKHVNTCSNWTTAGSGNSGMLGVNTETSNAWTSQNNISCNVGISLYCFQDTEHYVPPSPSPTPIPTPMYQLITNSATDKNCTTICSGMGLSCQSVGTDQNGQNSTSWSWNWSPRGCFPISSSNCSSVMTNSGAPQMCSGHYPKWTNCRCIPSAPTPTLTPSPPPTATPTPNMLNKSTQ